MAPLPDGDAAKGVELSAAQSKEGEEAGSATAAQPGQNGVDAAAAAAEEGKCGHGQDKDSKAEEENKEFVPSKGLTTAESEELLKKHGKNELEEKKIPKWLIFLQQLYGPMPIMIWIAMIIMAGIQNWPDFGILSAIQFANAFIGWYETTKAGDAVAALKASLKPVATVKRDGKFQTINAILLVPGDLVLLGAGSAVPADCIVNEGRIEVDQAALTGESLPVTFYKGDKPKMGSTVTRGEIEATVEFTGGNTFFGKTANLIQGVESLGNLQKILFKIMLVLVLLSLILCITTLVYIIVYLHSDVKEAIKFTVVLLVASIPVAIEIVCTTTLALGSRQLSVHGAIVTRLTAIEEMAGMNMLCSDKTGTLTLNKMVIQDDCPVFMKDCDREVVLRYAALAAKWKDPPRDALDTLVLGSVDLPSLDVYEQIDFQPFDPTIKRTEGTLKAPDGKVFKTTKGAPHIILKLVDVDKERVTKLVEAKVLELGQRGIRALGVAKTNPDNGDKWEMVGVLTFLDPPRPDTKHTIERAMEFGVDVKMITGDHTVIAKETARTLGMNSNILGAEGLPSMTEDGKIPPNLGKNYGKMIIEADGFAQVYPEHKYLIVEALRQNGFAVGMTGDGVNDAPALKRADVGIAVQGSTDAARAAADIVLTQPGLSVVVEAIVIARCIFQRIKTFINYRIAATLQLLCFFFIAVFALEPPDYQPDNTDEDWPDFFKIPVLMLMLITLLNDGTLISIAYDSVKPSDRPEKWNLKVLFLVSIVLGVVACGSSLLLLWAALDSHKPNSLFHDFSLPAIEYGKIVTMLYMKVSISDFLTLFSARTVSFFFTTRPANALAIGALCALSLSTALACVWPDGHTDGVRTIGLARGDYRLWPIWVWLYCLFWWFVQDALKVVAYKLIFKYNVFNANTAPLINAMQVSNVDDPRHPLTRVSMGMVESKVLGMKVDSAVSALDKAAAKSDQPSLNRASQNLQLMRGSITLTRKSLTGGNPADVEAGLADVKNMVAQVRQGGSRNGIEICRVESQVERATPNMPAPQRAEIEAQLEAVRRTADRFAAATESLVQKTTKWK